MKSLISILFALTVLLPCYSQNVKKGKVVYRTFTAASVRGNPGGEDPVRRLTIYLPPGYESGNRRYPTIYFLHGFLANDSLMMAFVGLNELMDEAIRSGKIRPMILVLPNSRTHYGGSFYTNSSLTGNWSDFIGRDVVQYMDQHFRTIPSRESRGLAGHSMGGLGALKVGMLFPETFCAVYALSPATLNWSNEFTLHNAAFKVIDSSKKEADAFKIFDSPPMSGSEVDFMTLVQADLGRTYSPNEKKSPFQADFPVRYAGDSLIVNQDILKRWEDNFPVNMISTHLQALKRLRALKIDWGRNDEFPHIPVTAMQFSKKLEAAGITHYAEEYIGTHTSGLLGFEGRFYTEMFPFFDRYLNFETRTQKK